MGLLKPVADQGGDHLEVGAQKHQDYWEASLRDMWVYQMHTEEGTPKDRWEKKNCTNRSSRGTSVRQVVLVR